MLRKFIYDFESWRSLFPLDFIYLEGLTLLRTLRYILDGCFRKIVPRSIKPATKIYARESHQELNVKGVRTISKAARIECTTRGVHSRVYSGR